MFEKIRDLSVLLPHRPPMLLLDEVVDYGEDFAIACVAIQRDSRFFDSRLDAVPAWIGIEYMAQTVGIWAGDQQLRAGRAVDVAFLLGTRCYRSNVHAFARDSVLTIRADVLYREESTGMGSFGCRIDGAEPGGNTIEVTARISALGPQRPEEWKNRKPE